MGKRFSSLWGYVRAQARRPAVAVKLALVLAALVFVLCSAGLSQVRLGNSVFTAKSVLAITGAFAVCVVLPFLPPVKKEKPNTALNIGVFLLSALAVLWCVEYLNFGLHMNTPLVVLSNILVYFTVYGLLYAAIGRLNIALPIGNSVFILLGVVNYFTFRFRGTILLPSDLNGAGTALDVLENYKLALTRQLAIVLWVWLVLLLLATRNGGQGRLKGLVKRGALGGASLVAAGFLGVLVLSPGAAKGLGFETSRLAQNEASMQNGYPMHFLVHVSDMIARKPAGYDPQTLALGEKSPDGGQRPHVVMILCESLVDYSVFGDLGASEDPLPFLHSLAESDAAYVGNFVVSIKGGSTSVTEYETLTGFSLAMEYSLSSPYFNYINGDVPSLGWYFKDLGYQTYATHPMEGSNWNREGAYPHLGFDEVYFIEEYAESELQYVRKWASDESTFGKVIQTFARNGTNSPLFMMAVTVQNHGGYTNEEYVPSITLGQYPGEHPETEQYLSLMKESDEALRGLLAYFETFDEPVIVVLYGDHWGTTDMDWFNKMYDSEKFATLGINEALLEYVTPVLLWSNYGVDFSGMPSAFSASYTPALLKQAAGLPLTGLDSFLLELRQEYPLLSMMGIQAADGSFYDPGEYSEIDDRLQTYMYAEYNGIFDTTGRRWDLFLYGGGEGG